MTSSSRGEPRLLLWDLRYCLKAGPAGGRLPRPSSAGGGQATFPPGADVSLIRHKAQS